MKSDGEIVKTAVNYSWYELKYTSEGHWRDRYIVMAAVKQNVWALEFLSEDIHRYG